ncbi:hypothetical protein EJB05_36469 [Eragrostis curvula]|uniref:Uncharacterized protein n=1 Tax=Eragrostis curvula TaxID=38414 RepID=A0A5J9U9N5_9POAL|nr:hypothetical protein EJB05_36469 [Eragrostis curvula]
MLATACRAPPCRWTRPGLLPAAAAVRYSCGYVIGRVASPRRRAPRRAAVVRCGLLPVDPWAPTVDSQSIASQLFAASLFPYLGFLYFMTKSKTAPGLTLFGFYFLLVFVGATKNYACTINCFPGVSCNGFIPGAVPAGIYAKIHYGTSLSNVDWLHGTAESLLTLTNLFIVLGLRGALRKLEDTKEEIS